MTKIVHLISCIILGILMMTDAMADIISAPTHGSTNARVRFEFNAEGMDSDTTFHWDFDDGTTVKHSKSRRTETQWVVHSFDEPDRYLVKLTITVGSYERPVIYHYINIGRPFEETVFALAGTDFSPSTTAVKEFSWLDCSPNYNIYDGKYFRLWIQASIDSAIDRQHIVNALVFSDYLFDAYSEIFGWDFLPGTDALDTYVCDGVGGAGTGSGGTFLNPSQFYGEVTQSITAEEYPDFVHEYIHLWDFRGFAWINAKDPAHAFTGGMEPIVNSLLGTGQMMTSWGGNPRALKSLPPNFVFNHYFRVNLNRYLSHPELDWDTYYGPEFLAIGYDDENVPENKEQMLVQGGLLMAIVNMHGREGLKSVFLQIDRTLHENNLLNSNLPQLRRSEIFMKAVADGLQLDVSDYFTYWKYPVESVADYMSKYPKSAMVADADGDGFSPLQNDRDDNDATVYPYAPELKDGKDNNQDGLVDETVYTEVDGDIDNIDIALPALIVASLSDLSDEDVFHFTLKEDAAVTFTIYSVDSDSTVMYRPGSNREVSITSGTFYLDGGRYSEIIHAAMSAPEGVSATFLSAGTHTIRIAAIGWGDINPNPGKYELQAFINDYDPGTTATSLLSEIYPLVTAHTDNNRL